MIKSVVSIGGCIYLDYQNVSNVSIAFTTTTKKEDIWITYQVIYMKLTKNQCIWNIVLLTYLLRLQSSIYYSSIELFLMNHILNTNTEANYITNNVITNRKNEKWFFLNKKNIKSNLDPSIIMHIEERNVY